MDQFLALFLDLNTVPSQVINVCDKKT